MQLSAIRTFVRDQAGGPEKPVWTYRLDYGAQASRATGRSLPRSVTQCDGADVCLNPTKLEYDDTALSATFKQIGSGILMLDRPDKGIWSRLMVMDLNGDGRDDVVYTTVDPNGKSSPGTDTDFFGAKHRRVALHFGGFGGLGSATQQSRVHARRGFDSDRSGRQARRRDEVPRSCRTGWRICRRGRSDNP